MVSEVDFKVCPHCGQAANAVPVVAGTPAKVGPAMANGSDEVRNSKTRPGPEPVEPGLANPGKPAGQII